MVTTRGSGGAGGPAQVPYRNPFREVKNLTPERVDMGVDYAGTGPVFALGPGVITSSGHAWAGAVGAPYPGTWITERLTGGPLKGQQVYVAEDIYDVNVHLGQKVDSSTVLGQLRGGLETGFAARGSAGASGETAAAAAGQAATGGDPGARPTAYGSAYSGVLKASGAPPGIESGKPVGNVSPSLWDQIKIGIEGGWNFLAKDVPGSIPQTGGSGSSLGDIAGGIGQIANFLDKWGTAVDWLVNPTHWVRIFAGVGGGILVLSGVWQLSHVGGDVPQAAALPVGMLLVGLGAVGLFVAFHNLPDEVDSFEGLLGFLNDSIHSGGQPA